MFTGLIETVGTIMSIEPQGKNKLFVIASPLASDLHPDESVAHDGVCLTITDTSAQTHTVVAIEETLSRSTLAWKKTGDRINLERALQLQDRLGGHFVQGHVDTVGSCISKVFRDGSWEYEFSYPEKYTEWLIEKGSICVNGISLTCFHIQPGQFRVAIVPYTYQHTNIQWIEPGDRVNIEFDMLGKYVVSLTKQYLSTSRA